MASTLTVQNCVDFARAHVKLAPILGIGGVSNEPGLTLANKVMKKILGRPYAWDFNRTSLTAFDTTNGMIETSPSITNVGWLERAYIELKASTATPKTPNYGLEVVQNIQKTDEIGYPRKVCVDREGATTTTLRFFPTIGNEIWTVYIDYQKKAPTLTALTGAGGTFDPIPDEYSDVILQLFLAFAYRLCDYRQYTTELAIAEALMAEKLGLNDAEPEGVSVYPERPILWGS